MGQNYSPPLNNPDETQFHADYDSRMESVIDEENIENLESNEKENKLVKKDENNIDKIFSVLEKLEKRINYLEKMCKKKFKKGIIEGFKNNSGKSYLDYLVLILMGIIIIFVLDSIFKIGKNIGSK